MRKRMSEEQKKEAQTPEDEVKKETGSAETSETPEEDNAPEAEETQEKAEEKTEEKADDGNEKYVRLMAEFQNYKKRVAKEKNDIREYATEKLVMELLPVLDNFERALAASAEDDPAGYAKGMELIFTQMVTELQKSGLAPSRAEARRNVEQGGVSVDGEIVKDIKAVYTKEQLSGEGIVVKRGKKNFRRVVVK